MTDDFDAHDWHDAYLLAINVDRRSAETKDEINIEICWPNGTGKFQD